MKKKNLRKVPYATASKRISKQKERLKVVRATLEAHAIALASEYADLREQKKKAEIAEAFKKVEWTDLECPEQFDFVDNPEKSREFFRILSEYLKAGLSVRLCFSDVVHISSECLLYLLGQMQKYVARYGVTRVTGAYPYDPGLEQLLFETGFFKLLQVVPRKRTVPYAGARRHLHFRSMRKLDGSIVTAIRTELFGGDYLMSPSIKSLVYKIVTEAMNNAHEHAYVRKKRVSQDMKRRWWFGASIDEEKKLFTIDFYDVGVGIPATVAFNYDRYVMNNYFNGPPRLGLDDAAILAMAVEVGRTRTMQTERGKGLADLHKLIDSVGKGCLRIYSRRGWYSYNGKPKYGNALGFLEGTLIHWEIPVESASKQLP